MDRQAIKRDLKGLNPEEAFALYYTKCRGESVSNVSDDANKSPFISKMSPGTVSNRAIQALRYLRVDDIREGTEYCIAFQELVDLLTKKIQDGLEILDWSEWPPEIPFKEPLPTEEVEEEDSSAALLDQTHNSLLEVPQDQQQAGDSVFDEEAEQTPVSSDNELEDSQPISRMNPIQNMVDAFRQAISGFGITELGILIVLILLLVFGGFLVGRFFETGRGPQDTDLSNTSVQEELSGIPINGQPEESSEPVTDTNTDVVATQEAIIAGALTAEAADLTRIFLSATPDATKTQIVIETSVSGTQTAVAATETAMVTPTPTPTRTPSHTPTITPTPTETPTFTPTPIILGVGEGYADDRISVELVDVELGGRYFASSETAVNAAVVFRFKFTNLIQSDVFNLTFIQKDFTLVDNLRREYAISKTNGGHSWANNQVSRVLDPNEEFNFVIGFGRQGDFDEKVDFITVTLNDFSSLGTIKWGKGIEN